MNPGDLAGETTIRILPSRQVARDSDPRESWSRQDARLHGTELVQNS